MCGIAGVHVKSAHLGRFPLDRFVDELFLGIEHRGRDASGYVAVNDEGEVMMQKAPVKASLFTRKRKTIPNSARTVLLHTRLATQGLPAFSEDVFRDAQRTHPQRRRNL
jgi:glucosamine 6-phosphate synthetase-like amidotransferase/phosphosugar isomerase protein